MPRRRKKVESFLDVLVTLPWWVSMVIAGLILVGLRWFLPAMWASNIFLKPLAMVLSNFAWLGSGFFFVIGLVILARQKMAARVGSNGTDPTFRSPLPPIPQPASHSGGEARGAPQTGRDPLESAGRELRAAKRQPMEWSLDLLRNIEWKRFEDLCQKFYETKGIRSETTPLGPDGGIDIRLYDDNAGAATAIVQCKAWGERAVGVKPVRELLGVMVHENIAKAFFMTSGTFSDEARAFAQNHRITLVDGNMFLMMIQRLPSESRQVLLEVATAGDYTTPTCPRCGIKMRRVLGTQGRPDFWGCGNYPRCRQKLQMRRST